MSDALFTDLYELTMMAGYHAAGRADDEATFDLYFRKKVLTLGLVVEAPGMRRGPHRPAQLYRFRETALVLLDDVI